MSEARTIRLTSVTVIIIISLLIGAGVVFAIQYIRSKAQTPSPPVVVRGGSVEGRAPVSGGSTSGSGWTVVANSPPTLQTSAPYSASYLSLDGVIPKGGTTIGQYSASGLTENWKVTLFFRDKNGNDPGDSAKKLFLCSDQNCDAKGALAASTPIFLVGESSNGSFTPEGILDGYDVREYDLTTCEGTTGLARETLCNHPARVRVEGISKWDDGSTVFEFKCPAGECDIYAGS